MIWYNMREASKKLKIKGIGRNNLMAFLKEQIIIMPNGMPQDALIECGYFNFHVTSISSRQGRIIKSIITPLISASGIDYIFTII